MGICGKAQAFDMVGEVQLMGLGGGVTGDGVRTVPLSFKATVKLIQVVGQAWIVSGVGGL